MTTIGLYVIIMAAVVAVVFAVVWFAFGRGEDLPAVAKGRTLTRLPREGITGDDVRALIFTQRTRGYEQAEVDWALEKLAREIDELRAVVDDLTRRRPADDVHSAGVVEPSPKR
ncbi:DivIVA domain-containing protein [Gordonia sp. VNK21]|uniref:DivIVA domain-containing protein n=1 Tax=Gordonia sp. VNK21 TaxID=3382483 RepID=UPI0038D44E46